MYLVKTPKVVKHIFPTYYWDKPNDKRAIYLTFDDGPIPEVTPWVLDQLASYDAKATFFCVGDNVRKYPQIFNRLKEEGHKTGNHTFNHLNGWNTPVNEYVENVDKCAELVDSDLFRPPYGKLSRKQSQHLSENYSVVMWDILSGDFDPTITNENCLKNVVNHAVPGSIIVFHDNIKSYDKLQYVLPRVLEYFSQKNYTFSALEFAKSKKAAPALMPA